jgi:hypothetical protein
VVSETSGTKKNTRDASDFMRGLPFWVLILIVLLASASLWGPGIVNTRGGGDSPFLLQRLHQMTVNLRVGVFPVRWMPDAAYGLGYPFFNHYSALPFYLASTLNVMGLDSLTALKLTQTLGFLFAALAMYGWIYHIWRRRAAAFLAAVAYTLAPFHLVNVYVRGDSLSEFYAFVWYPLILWALDLVFERRSARDVVLLALSYAGLITTHNLSAFIFSPFVLLYLLLLVWRTPFKSWRLLGLGLGGVILGVALSAWVWMPALLETRYVQPETLTTGYFHYSNQFRSANLVQTSLGFDYDIAPTLGGPSPFAMGGPQALLVLLGSMALLWWIFTPRQSASNEEEVTRTDDETRSAVRWSSGVFVVIGLVLSTVMITPLSQPLWDYLPLLEMVQFPWRFLSVQSLFAAAVIGALVMPLRRWRTWAVAGAIALLLMASTLLRLRPERLLIGPEDVTATRLQEYELFTSNIGTTIRWEWLPAAVVPRPFTSDAAIEPDASPQVVPISGTLIDAVQTQLRSTEQVWSVRTGGEGATLALPLYFWPGWAASVDGVTAPVWAVEGSGHLAVKVPPGEHMLRVNLGRTPLRAAAEILSLVTLLAIAAAALWRMMRSRSRETDADGHNAPLDRAGPTTHYARLVLPALFILLIGVLFLYTQSRPPTSRADDLTMDFVAIPYLHHNPDGIRFAGSESGSDGDQARLLYYAYSGERVEPGDTLTVTLQWDEGARSVDGRQATLRLVSPAEHLPHNGLSSYALAEETEPLSPITVHRLSVPANAPRGLYLLQLSLGGSDGEMPARTPLGAERGPLYLRPIRVTEGAPLAEDAPLLAAVGPDMRLHAAHLEPTPESDDLTIHLEWSAARRMARNYKISVRLLDPDGDMRVSRDTQPGYGFAPTSLWRPGERIGDRYVISLPDDLPPGDGYRLSFVFYQEPSLAEVARVELGPFALPLASPLVFEPRPRLFELPVLSQPLDVDFTGPAAGDASDHIQLAGADLMVEGEVANLSLWWIALSQPQKDYTVFVHLFDPADPALIVTQNDAMPRQGSYPTSSWLGSEVVSDTIRLSLADVPPGTYRLALGLYDATTMDRLVVIGPDGLPLPDGRLILPGEVEVPAE